jgi:5-methylcytosine-specific restriction endonuclease McrA
MRMLGPRVRVADLRTAKPPAKTVDDFYLSAEWSAFRARMLRERGGRCQHKDCQDPDASGVRILHHIHERRDGGADLDPANVAFLCSPCHGRVTAAAAARAAARVG